MKQRRCRYSVSWSYRDANGELIKGTHTHTNKSKTAARKFFETYVIPAAVDQYRIRVTLIPKGSEHIPTTQSSYE